MSGTGRILVVDDDPEVRETVIAVLELEGYAVSGAANGRAALDVLESVTPDVIVLDLTMPVLSGRGFLDAVRATRWAGRPIVLLTAEREVSDLVVRARLEKPFELEDLLDAVRDAVAAGRARVVETV